MGQSAAGRSEAFWNEFMRRPDAKAAYQAERRLQAGRPPLALPVSSGAWRAAHRGPE
jgi:hypothetical protein